MQICVKYTSEGIDINYHYFLYNYIAFQIDIFIQGKWDKKVLKVIQK